MKVPVFTGCATALVTPFASGGVNFSVLQKLMEEQAASGVSALVIAGTTGEAATLSERERDALLRFAVERKGRMKIIAGIGGNDTEKAAAAAQHSAELGADALLLTTPYYNKANTTGLIRHFTSVADAVTLPLIVYNVPSRTAVHCTEDVYRELAAHPNINGVKEASGSISLAARTRRLCGDELYIWCGNDDQTLPMMALGAKGVISVASNVIPKETAALCEACLRCDYKEALLLHDRWQELFEMLFIEVNPIPVKTALTMLGLEMGGFRLPLDRMQPQNEQRLKDCLIRSGLLPG